MKQLLLKKLNKNFNPQHLEVINESHMHSGGRVNSHFKIVIVSNAFEDVKLIDRHRSINNLFKDELQKIHALSIHTYTLSEWQKAKKAPDTPNCQGVK